jgi:putative ABC transport system permease protein
MSTNPTAPRLALRLACRELVRRPWRTALVVLMVLIPCAGMAFVTVMFETSRWSQLDELEAISGQVDALGEWYDQGTPAAPPADQLDVLAAALPAGSEIAVQQSYRDRVADGDARAYFEVRDLDLASPITQGRIHTLDGRTARSEDEVVLSDGLAAALDVGVGDTVRPDRLDRDLQVVGVVTFRGGNEDLAYLGGPIDVDALRALGARPISSTLIDLPGRPFLGVTDAWTQPVIAEVPSGWQIHPNLTGTAPSTAVGLFWTYVAGGVALVVLGTVITAAFAISARRQLHVVGLLSASGASPRTINRLLVAQGALTGAVGAVLGIGLGIGVAALIPRDLLREVVGHHVDGLAIPLLPLLPILLIGTLGAAAASAVPARSASRVSTLQALAGRRPLPTVPRRLPTVGVISLLAGAALFAMAVSGSRSGGSSLWALVAISGALATLAGVCMLAPWFVARLEPWAGRWSQSWRLAGRSLARNRVRSSAVVGAICAVAATFVAGSTLWATDQTDETSTSNLPYLRSNQVIAESWVDVTDPVDPDEAGPLPPEPMLDSRPVPVDETVVDAVTTVLPDAQIVELPLVGSDLPAPPSWSLEDGSSPAEHLRPPHLQIATTELLELFAVPDELRHEITDGGAVAVGPVPDEATGILGGGGTAVELVGRVASPEASMRLPDVLVSAATADDLGLTFTSGPLLWSTEDPLTAEQRRRLELVNDDLWWEHGESWGAEPIPPVTDGGPRTETVPPPDATPRTDLGLPGRDPVDEALIRAAVLAGVLLVMLAVVAVGLALAAKDNEDERQVLAAVGAPPRTLRRVGALRAVLLVALAGVIALPAGLLPAAAIHSASTAATWDERTFAVDPTSLVFVVVLVPAIAGLVVWLAGSVRDLARPRRPDTFSFGD